MENRTIITGEIARQRGRISAGQTEGELRNWCNNWETTIDKRMILQLMWKKKKHLLLTVLFFFMITVEPHYNGIVGAKGCPF
jgi:hypothetical protein